MTKSFSIPKSLGMHRRLNNGSWLKREVHVRFCEGLGGRFFRSAHPKLLGPVEWTYYCLNVILDISHFTLHSRRRFS